MLPICGDFSLVTLSFLITADPNLIFFFPASASSPGSPLSLYFNLFLKAEIIEKEQQ